MEFLDVIVWNGRHQRVLMYHLLLMPGGCQCQGMVGLAPVVLIIEVPVVFIPGEWEVVTVVPVLVSV